MVIPLKKIIYVLSMRWKKCVQMSVLAIQTLTEMLRFSQWILQFVQNMNTMPKILSYPKLAKFKYINGVCSYFIINYDAVHLIETWMCPWNVNVTIHSFNFLQVTEMLSWDGCRFQRSESIESYPPLPPTPDAMLCSWSSTRRAEGSWRCGGCSTDPESEPSLWANTAGTNMHTSKSDVS